MYFNPRAYFLHEDNFLTYSSDKQHTYTKFVTLLTDYHADEEIDHVDTALFSNILQKSKPYSNLFKVKISRNNSYQQVKHKMNQK